MKTLASFALVTLFFACSLATAADTKVLNNRGQVIGSVQVTGNTIRFRDARGNITGKAVVTRGKITLYDRQGRRKP